MADVKVRFWGVRGSIPAPLTAKDVERKELAILKAYHAKMLELERGTLIDPEEFFGQMIMNRLFPATHGGNTSSVSVCFEDEIFALDMGTGLRSFGDSLVKKMKEQKGLKVRFFASHEHWDHLHGVPFFGPLYANKHKDNIRNEWDLYGGTNWQKPIEECLAMQMSSPSFPVSWETIKAQTERISSSPVCHGLLVPTGKATMQFGLLDHPQETYGSRLVFPGDRVIAYTTDNEPRDPLYPDENLLTLAQGAHYWITDCQYTKQQYEGHKDHGGVSRQRWGHSYPEAVAKTAVVARVHNVVLFHHDPASSDEKINEMVRYTQQLIDDDKDKAVNSKVIAAWEGLEFTL